ncbi:MAG: OOP family OmpA-OmpF porin [Saprospiraceae bacterium]|jgi:OOP family OmpA-OmpF porin
MKKLYLLYLILLTLTTGFSQTGADIDIKNIVPNPGFETYSGTPIGWFYKGQHFTDVMKYWDSATAASPDVFGPKVRVPAHWASKGFGKQTPHRGESMVGITGYGCEEGKPHCREYIQIQLVEPLVIGQGYYAEFFVSHLPRSIQIDRIGMFFSTSQIKVKTDVLLEFKPQVVAKNILSAPEHRWIKVSGTFIADTEAEYLIIGNFHSDSLTEKRIPFSNCLNYAYYYIDDVVLKKTDPFVKVPVKENDLCCITVEEGKIIQLSNIFFDTDKAELLPRSFAELNKLLNLMQDNSGMVIEIRGHTDSMGEDNYNMYLSRKRAKAVVEFLNENGISRSRTRYKGFGNTDPVATNQSEEGRQLNRRVEFLIIKT